MTSHTAPASAVPHAAGAAEDRRPKRSWWPQRREPWPLRAHLAMSALLTFVLLFGTATGWGTR